MSVQSEDVSVSLFVIYRKNGLFYLAGSENLKSVRLRKSESDDRLSYALKTEMQICKVRLL